ncbi:MAG: HPr(Ser) kinase/phosphatase [Verrucomicrobiota bacterium]
MAKPEKAPRYTVRDFFESHAEELKLTQLASSKKGLKREIKEPTVNRPGLALSGFFTYFAKRRIQVLGNSEMSYLRTLPAERRKIRFTELCQRNIPCLIIARKMEMPPDLLAIAEEFGIAVLRTSMITMKFINLATLRLEWDFAPTALEHGCMVDVRGIGIFIRGKSGSGKSEAVLGLLERGWSLVADDSVRFRAVGQELIGSATELGKAHMEVRGIGIINTTNLFGIGTLRLRKKLDLVVTLLPAKDLNEVDRFGSVGRSISILEVDVPHVELAVAPGRDTARMIEVAALDQKLKDFGYDAAEEFNNRLIALMQSQTRD